MLGYRIYLENVKTELNFSDENGNCVLGSSDPANTDALFFIVDLLENIDDAEGNGISLVFRRHSLADHSESQVG